MKIAILQNKWHQNIEEGLRNIVKKAREILKDKDIDFLLLPEFFMGPAWFQPGQGNLKGITDDTIPGRVSELFSGLAKEYHVHIIMGTIIERREDKYYNTSAIIDREGTIVGKINKMHTFAGEKATCVAASEIKIIETDKATIGMGVCSDFWIPEFMKILVLKGAEVIFIPGGTLGQNTDSMIQALKTIAYLTSSVVVYSSAVGTITGMRGEHKICMEYTGSSVIITPEEVFAIGSRNDADVLIADLPDNYIKEYRENSLCWHRLCSAKQSVYTEILEKYVGIELDYSQ